MKTLGMYLFAALVLVVLSGSVPAVEKKPKETPPTKQPVVPTPKKNDSQTAKSKQRVTPPKKFDDFIDKNKNGVDDRKESVKKPEPK